MAKKSGGGGVTRQGGPAYKPKGSGAQIKPPLMKTASGKPWRAKTPKRVADRTASGKVDTGGGKKVDN